MTPHYRITGDDAGSDSIADLRTPEGRGDVGCVIVDPSGARIVRVPRGESQRVAMRPIKPKPLRFLTPILARLREELRLAFGAAPKSHWCKDAHGAPFVIEPKPEPEPMPDKGIVLRRNGVDQEPLLKIRAEQRVEQLFRRLRGITDDRRPVFKFVTCQRKAGSPYLHTVFCGRANRSIKDIPDQPTPTHPTGGSGAPSQPRAAGDA